MVVVIEISVVVGEFANFSKRLHFLIQRHSIQIKTMNFQINKDIRASVRKS